MRRSCERHPCIRGALIAAGMIALCAPAHAQEQRGRGEKLLIFPMESGLADAKSHVPSTLNKSLKKAAEARGMKVTMSQTSLEDMAMIAGCASPDKVSCHELVLTPLGSDSGMTSRVEAGEPGRLKVTVRYFDGKSSPTEQTFDVAEENAAAELEGAVPALFGDPVASQFQGLVVDSSSSAFALGRVHKTSWMIMGGGGALMGTGMIFWLTASQRQGEIDSAPTATADDLDRLADLEGNAKTRATIGNVLFFSGVAVAAVGTYFAVRQGLGSGPGHTVESADGAEKPAGMTWAPVLLPGGAGLTLSMKWQ